MNVIDQAFIRAYETNDIGPSPRTRHSRPAPASAADIVVDVISSPQASAPTPVPHVRVYAEPAAASQTPATERRPLSTFSNGPTVESRFQPAFEVDAFRWSAVCSELVERHQALWRPVVDALLAADDGGRSLIGVAGGRRHVGTTTAMTCLARLLTEAGKSVAMVDGDFTSAGLARSLGLAAELGWEDVLAGRTPLADAVVHSLDDSLALLPLVQGGAPAAEKLDSIHASVTAGVLRYHYDLVLFDLGAVADERQAPIARRIARRCRLDAVLLTVDAAAASMTPPRLTQSAPELADICVGLIDIPCASA